MSHDTSDDSSAMESALSAYADWLAITFSDKGTPKASGTAVLTVIADLQRRGFPDATRAMGDLLILHSKIADMVFENKMAALRGLSPHTMTSPVACDLAQAQRAALQVMHRTCVREVTRIETQHLSKAERPVNSAHPEHVRPASQLGQLAAD
jgi:hypothetical protein